MLRLEWNFSANPILADATIDLKKESPNLAHNGATKMHAGVKVHLPDFGYYALGDGISAVLTRNPGQINPVYVKKH